MANSEGKEQNAALEHFVEVALEHFMAPVASQRAPRVAWADCQVGDTFVFGNYPQGANGEVKPIEWQVLRRDSDGLLVISKYALDCKRYNEYYCGITWSQCTLRKWLNSEFINKAFDATERQQIKQVHLQNPNSKFDESVPGGSDTDDKIFLLSHDEAESLFADDGHRLCKPTDYAVANNAWVDEDSGACHGIWWLRSPGYDTNDAAYIYHGGGINYSHVASDSGFVRPAFKIALSSSSTSVVYQCASRVALANCQVGDTLVFGNYPQDANGGSQPIEWQVLRRDSDGLLVISKYVLDCKQYNENYCGIGWSQCTLRKWLNSEFINKAFDATERQQIKQVHLQHPNSKFNESVPGGPDTDDKIFLLSHNEAESLFSSSEKRKCKPTEYAKKNNAYTADNGMCWWWLRSPGFHANCAAVVILDGGIRNYVVDRDNYGVRPAFKIAL